MQVVSHSSYIQVLQLNLTILICDLVTNMERERTYRESVITQFDLNFFWMGLELLS